MLERHPGVDMVPEWPASRLRLYWVGMIALNVAIGALFYFFFPGLTDASPEPTSPPDWLPILFPIFFIGIWVLVCLLLSGVGGWGTWARHYAAQDPFRATKLRFRSGQTGNHVNYRSCLTFGADREVLYLAVLPLFRVGHPPLRIPWSDVCARESRGWVFEYVDLEFAKAPGTSLKISRSLAQALFDAAGMPVRVQPAA
jgi:hypothetical protein